jgi:hypothetical protein
MLIRIAPVPKLPAPFIVSASESPPGNPEIFSLTANCIVDGCFVISANRRCRSAPVTATPFGEPPGRVVAGLAVVIEEAPGRPVVATLFEAPPPELVPQAAAPSASPQAPAT